MVTLDPDSLIRLALVFVRLGGVMVAAPVFGQKSIPVQVKVLLAAILSLVLYRFAEGALPPYVDQPVGFVLALACEALTGLLIGYAIRFVFWAVEFAGEIIGFQTSLSMAQAFDPTTGAASNPLGKVVNWAFLLLFILLDGPQDILVAINNVKPGRHALYGFKDSVLYSSELRRRTRRTA